MATYSATLTYYDGYSSTWSSTETTTAEPPYVIFSLPTLTRTGYTFDGWNFGGNTYTGSITLYAYYNGYNYNVTAQWTQIPSYTIGADITWDNNGGTPATYTHSPRVTSETAGGYIGVSTPLSAPTRAGYHFDGWIVSGNLKQVGDSVTLWADTSIPSYTWTAQWSAETYVVTIDFDADGGSPTPGHITTSYTTPATYANVTMPSTPPTKAGYAFDGWGSGHYQPGQTYQFTGGDYTLVAQWLGIPASGKVRIKTSNGWVTATPYVKTSNGWKQTYAHVNDGEGWLATNG